MRLAPSREAARNKRLDLSKAGLEALKARHAIGCGKTESEGRVAVRVRELRRLKVPSRRSAVGLAESSRVQGWW
jgi:hypothetical protein